MPFNPQDITYSLIKEAVPGTTPTATPAFLRVDYAPSEGPRYVSDSIMSPSLAPKRGSRGKTKTNKRVEGSLSTHFRRDAAYELLLESALSGSFTTNVLKQSDVDASFTMERKDIGDLTAYHRFRGMQVGKFNLKCDFDGNATADYDLVGLGKSRATAIMAGQTYVAASNKVPLNGQMVSNVSIAGITGLSFTSLDLTIDAKRVPLGGFGTDSALFIGQEGPFEIGLSLTFFRTNFQPEDIFEGNGTAAVSFTLGTGAEGFKFDLPVCTGEIPTDDYGGAATMVTVDLSAQRDETSDTMMTVTRL